MTLHESIHQILDSSKDRLGEIFYEVFIERCPEVQAHFEGVNLRVQSTMLMNALQIIASHSTHLRPATSEYLKILGHRHFQRQIPAELYAPFCEAMLVALERFHGDSWDPQLADEWRAALNAGTKMMLVGHVPGAMSY